MSRAIALAVLTSLALAVLAGCGSGPGLDEPSGGGFAAAIPAGFVPLAKYAGTDEAVDEAGNELPADVAAASPLKLCLIGGEAPRTATVGGKKYRYYPVRVGESRPLVAEWNGGVVTDPPIWKVEAGANGPFRINAATPTPVTLNGNCLRAMFEVPRPCWIKVTYGGYTKRVWVWPQGNWSPVGQTAALNDGGARLKIVGASSMWSSSFGNGMRYFQPKQSGKLTLRGVIVPTGSYPGAPTPVWTANQNRLKFASSATGWMIRFRIKRAGDSYLTAMIPNATGDDYYAVTVRITK